MVVWLMALASVTTANAATITLTAEESTVLAETLEGATDGDVIELEPGVYYLTQQVTIPADTSITLKGLGDTDIDDEVIVQVDWNSFWDPAGSPPEDAAAGDFSVFDVKQGATFLVRDVMMKELEWPQLGDCEDGLDLDGNGWTDGLEPLCAEGIGDASAAETGLNEFAGWPGSARLFTVRAGATLTLRRAWIQGWHSSHQGSVIWSKNGTVDIDRSWLHYNGPWRIPLLPNFWWTENQGGVIYAWNGGEVIIRDSSLFYNRARVGGVLYANDVGLVTIERNGFKGNTAHQGGAIAVDDGTDLLARQNFFTANAANTMPADADELFIPPNEGGAVWAKDSTVDIHNNVFQENMTLDEGAAVWVWRNDGADPNVYNNTFAGQDGDVDGGGVLMFDETTFSFWNNIISHSFGGSIAARGWDYGTPPDVRYNDFFETVALYTGELAGLPVPTDTNIFDDPMYLHWEDAVHQDYSVWNFIPDAASTTINAGDPDVLDVGGTRSDMGAYGGVDALSAEDRDHDGWEDIYDCDDLVPTIYPGADEPCDGIDNDCNGIIDDQIIAWYPDRDLDGYGSINEPALLLCPEEPPPEVVGELWSRNNDDCNDINPRANPVAPEFCDFIDNDCNGMVDDNISAREQYVDADGDGFGDGNPTTAVFLDCAPDGYSPWSGDCDDHDNLIHPLVTLDKLLHLPLADHPIEASEFDRDEEYVADGEDQDCDGFDLCFADFDGDGFGSDKLDPPDLAVDNDLNCSNTSSGTANSQDDCNDGNPTAFPGGIEVAGDRVDQNCDGVDDCFQDLDQDGYGNPEVIESGESLDCNDSIALSSKSDDCDDTSEKAHPGGEEICDSFDNNCDGVIDEITDDNATLYFLDEDRDQFGVVTDQILACGQPTGYASQSGDCNDRNPDAFPGADEVCDEVDNDCNGGVDEPESSIDAQNWYEDSDEDGFGNFSNSELGCDPPAEGTWVGAGLEFDCNDTDAVIGPCVTCDGCASTGDPTRVMPSLLGLLAMVVTRRRRRGVV